MMMNKLKVATIALLLVCALPAHSETASMVGKIVRTLNSNSDSWGGCMIRLDKAVREETGLDCSSSWVSFSCSGVKSPKDQAYKMFDAAQMAMALNYRVQVFIDDQQKESGYCLATRLDVIAN